MATLNPLTFSDIPTTSTVLSSDKIITFTEVSNGNLQPVIMSVQDFVVALSAWFIEEDPSIANFEEQTKTLQEKVTQSIKTSVEKYANAVETRAIYSTISNLNNVINTIEKTADFKKDTKDKADNKYLNYWFNWLKASIQRMKDDMGREVTNKYNSDNNEGYKQLIAERAYNSKDSE